MPAQQDEEHQRVHYGISGMMQRLINDVGGCPYFVLGTEIFCSDKEVKKAYYKFSQQYHPDKSRQATEEVQALNEEKMKCINSAKDFLEDKTWKRLYEEFFKQSAPPQPFNHSLWSLRLIGKPESSGFAEPPSPRQFNSYEVSYDRARKWIRQKVDRKEIEHDRDIVALIIRDILKDRNYQLIELYAKEDWYQQDLKEYVKHGILFENVPIDLVFLKMFECYPHIFPLTCGFALDMLNFDEDQCVKDEKNYKSKWSKKKKDFDRGKDAEYNELDFIEKNCGNQAITFVIPVFEDSEHWTGIVRRWIKQNLHFFYCDSYDKSVKNIKNSTVVKEIPTRILLLLMDSPLWPRGQTAYWTRLPNVKQQEFECGARMLLHSFLVAFSENPFETLIPLNYVGQPTKSRQHPLYSWRSENLPNLSRLWVHNIIKHEEFMIPAWMIPVAEMTKTLQDGIFSYGDWKTRFCLEQHCSLEEVIRLSGRFQEEIREEEIKAKLAQEKAKAKLAQEKAIQAASSKKKKGRLKKAGKVAAASKNSPGKGNSGENVEKGNVDSMQQDIGPEKSPVAVELADTEDDGEREEMIPQNMREQEGVYEFDANITNGAVMITIAKSQYLPDGYNCVFQGYRQHVDGTIGYIEQHKLIRNYYDVLIGLNGIHVRGWEFEKILERIKQLAGGKHECIITFTFADFCLLTNRPRPTPSSAPNPISLFAAAITELAAAVQNAAPDSPPPATNEPNAAADRPPPATQVPNAAAGLPPPATQVPNVAADRPPPAQNVAADHPPPATQASQITPPCEAQQVTTAPSLVQKVLSSLKRLTTSPKRTSTVPAVNGASLTNPEAMAADNDAPHTTNIINAQPSTSDELNATPSVTNEQPSGELESQTNPEAMAVDNGAPHTANFIAAQPSTTDESNATLSVTIEQPSGELASQTNPEAMAADNGAPNTTNIIAAQHSTTEELNATPSVTNEQPSGELASQTNPEAMATDNDAPHTTNIIETAFQTNTEALAEEYAARPEAATLTDEVINNRHLYGFEVVKGTSLGLRLCPLLEDSSFANFYNSAFGGYHTVNNTEGYIEMNKLIRQEGDVLVGINRVDLSGWPHNKVQHHIQNLVSERTVSTIHLTFMDVFRANDLYLQHVTNLENSNKRKRAAEEDSQFDQNDADEDEEPGTKSNEATSDVEVEMALDNSVGDPKTTQPSEDELNTVVVHPAIRDIPEHTELFKYARESNFDHVIRRYRPVEFTQYIYYRRGHCWRGNSRCGGSELCFGWMCEYFEDDFIKQCIENADELQDTPTIPQLYREEKKIFRVMYENKKKRWWGYFGQTVSEEVSKDWVTENFPEWFVNKCLDKPNKKHRIHAGDAKTNMDLTVTGLKPPVFLQNGKPTCVFSSLASGLMYLNDKKASDFILQHIKPSEEASDAIGCAILLLAGVGIKYSAKIYKSGMGALKIFDDISCFPTVVRLKSSDGSAGHCVTIVGLWVFDSNKAEAEPLSYEFLDWCCSTDTQKDRFVSACYAVRFIHLKPRKEWNLCDQCRNGEGKQKCIYKFR